MTANNESNSNKRKQGEVDSDGNQKIDSVFKSDINKDKEETSTSEPPQKAQKVNDQDKVDESSKNEDKQNGKAQNGGKKNDENVDELQVDDVGVEKTESADQDDNKYTLLERGQ